MAITVDGELQNSATAKDVILRIIGKIGTGGSMGHMVEYRGSSFAISRWRADDDLPCRSRLALAPA